MWLERCNVVVDVVGCNFKSHPVVVVVPLAATYVYLKAWWLTSSVHCPANVKVDRQQGRQDDDLHVSNPRSGVCIDQSVNEVPPLSSILSQCLPCCKV